MIQGYAYEDPAYRQAGVSFSVRGLRQVLKTNLPNRWTIRALYLKCWT